MPPASPLQRGVFRARQIALKRHALQSSNLHCTPNCSLQYIDPSLRIVPPGRYNSMPCRLPNRAPVRQPRLRFITNATVEILTSIGISPERFQPQWELVINELSYRAMKGAASLPVNSHRNTNNRWPDSDCRQPMSPTERNRIVSCRNQSDPELLASPSRIPEQTLGHGSEP